MNTETDIYVAESLKHSRNEMLAKRRIFSVYGCAQSESISELITSAKSSA